MTNSCSSQNLSEFSLQTPWIQPLFTPYSAWIWKDPIVNQNWPYWLMSVTVLSIVIWRLVARSFPSLGVPLRPRPFGAKPSIMSAPTMASRFQMIHPNPSASTSNLFSPSDLTDLLYCPAESAEIAETFFQMTVISMTAFCAICAFCERLKYFLCAYLVKSCQCSSMFVNGLLSFINFALSEKISVRIQIRLCAQPISKL